MDLVLFLVKIAVKKGLKAELKLNCCSRFWLLIPRHRSSPDPGLSRWGWGRTKGHRLVTPTAGHRALRGLGGSSYSGEKAWNSGAAPSLKSQLEKTSPAWFSQFFLSVFAPALLNPFCLCSTERVTRMLLHLLFLTWESPSVIYWGPTGCLQRSTKSSVISVLLRVYIISVIIR